MLIKLRDATPDRISELEHREVHEKDPVKRIEIHQALGRLRADTTTQESCDFLNQLFADSDDWMLLHDVRLEIDRKKAAANHVLIDRSLRFYWIDTRYIDCGLTLHSSGACTAHRAGRDKIQTTQIASPLNKLQKDLRTFSTAIRKTQSRLGWAGFIKPPIIKGIVLTSTSIKNSIPRDGSIDGSSLVNKDSLFPLIWKSREGDNGLWSRETSDETMGEIANRLLEQHQVLVKPELYSAGKTANSKEMMQADSSHCFYCHAGVAPEERDYSFRNMDVFRGKVVCLKCQNRPEVSRRSMRVEYQT